MVGTVGGRKGVLCLEGEGSRSSQFPGSRSVHLGVVQHSRLKPSREGFHDPQIPVNLEVGDMVFLERKEIEIWASEGP